MRNISTELYNRLAGNETLVYFLLVYLRYRDGSQETSSQVRHLRFTTHPYPLVFEGNTFSTDIGIISYEPPQFSSVVAKNSYKITVADHTGELAVGAMNSMVGLPLQIWLGFCDASGTPILTTSDVSLAYSGIVDGVSLITDFETKYIQIEGSSPMADLDLVNVHMTSANGMDQINKSDTSYDLVLAEDDVSFKWGKA